MLPWRRAKLARIEVAGMVAGINESAPDDYARLAAFGHLLARVERTRGPVRRSVALLALAGLISWGCVVLTIAFPGHSPEWFVFIVLGLNGYAGLTSWVLAHGMAVDFRVTRRAIFDQLEAAAHRVFAAHGVRLESVTSCSD
jgi:hypothetical protein